MMPTFSSAILVLGRFLQVMRVAGTLRLLEIESTGGKERAEERV